MEKFVYGNPEARVVLVQMVDDHDLAGMEREVTAIRQQADVDFSLLAFKVDSWQHDLSPWPAPAVFGNEDFGDGAAKTLKEVLKLVADREKTYYLGGYSLAGLFALWAATQTDRFSGIAAASPSVWFPHFYAYLQEQPVKSPAVYLSLGTKEKKARNPVMATVEDRIREVYALLRQQEINTVLAWNPGNHFKDPDLRTASAFAWVMKQAK